MGCRRVGLCLCAIDGIGVDRGEGRAICTFFGVRDFIFDGKRNCVEDITRRASTSGGEIDKVKARNDRCHE